MPKRIGLLIVLVGALLICARGVYAQDGAVHVVQQGETLTRIAQNYHVSVDALIAANHLQDANALYVGQRLIIPGSAPQASSQSAPSTPGTYTVQRGDTLTGVSTRYGVPIDQLMAVNKITDPGLVRIGQVLTIPGNSGDTAPASPSQPPLPDGPQTFTAAAGPAISIEIVNGHLASLTLQAVSSGVQSMPLSCEAKIASQIATMYGLNFTESAFQNALPHSLNPQRGFVGSVNGRFYWPTDVIGGTAYGPGGYGVHVEGWAPTFEALSNFQVRFLAADPSAAQAQIDAALRHGYPIAVWAILGFRAALARNSVWIGSTGDGAAVDCGGPWAACFYLASGEHAYLILGRKDDNYLVYDPGSGVINYWSRSVVITGITTLFAESTGSAPGAVIVPHAANLPDLSRLPGWQS